MAVDFSKLLEHPDKEEIISKLVTGTSPKDISDWLKLKYKTKEQSHLRLSVKMLKDFADNNMDLYATLRKDITAVKSGTLDKEISASLRNNKTYQERIQECADTELDIKKVLVDTGVAIQARIEQYYDKIQENPNNLRPDHGLIKWFELLLNYADRYQKIVNEAPDQVIQHNITVEMVEKHTAFLQDAIREVMAELDPEVAFLFMEKMNEKMAKLQPPIEKQLNQDKRMEQAQILSNKAASIVED